jgi:2'-5' RNA ligase
VRRLRRRSGALTSELRTALVVEVPEAAPAVDGWRERTSPAKPSNGVPAHVTILFPFAPAAGVDDELLHGLRALFAGFAAFRFELRECRHFPAVLYLAPEPPEPFVSLTEAVVAAYPEFLPYEGVFDSIVPHLTAAEGEPAVLGRAERDVRQWLPIAAEANEVVLLEEVERDPARWHTHTRLSLGAP